ncbi:MAG: AAA family ATPase [Terracoccus sp.]
MVTVHGRQRQLAAVERALGEVAAGRGQLLLVSGEAGIGKSMVAQAALDRADAAGLATARGYAVDEPGAPALWPWRRLGRDVPALAATLAEAASAAGSGSGSGESMGDAGDAAARFALCDAACVALAGSAAPDGLVVLLEDFHWADALSVAVLRHLVHDLAATQLLVVVTAREVPGSPYGRATPDLVRSPVTHQLPLAGLGAPTVARWLEADAETEAWAPFADELVRRTNGNPLYIETLTSGPPPAAMAAMAAMTANRHTEVLDDVLAERADLRAVLIAPFHRLPDATRRTVAVAALLAERLTPSLIADAATLPTSVVSDHLASAVSAGVLRFGPTGLAFTHALVRDAVVADLDDAERITLHTDIALAMERSGDDLLVGPSAVHWEHASGPEAARHCRDQARRAAALASRSLAPELAAAFARLALRRDRELNGPSADLAELLIEVARHEWAAGELPETLRLCAEAVDLAEANGRPDLMALAALVPQGVGSVDVTTIVDGLCSRALRRLPPDSTALRARLLGLRAIAASDEGVDSLADRLSSEALALAVGSGDVDAELEAVAARHFVISYPQAIEERTTLTKRAVELTRQARTPMGHLWGLLWWADIALQVGDLDRLQRVVDDIEGVERERSSTVARWHRLRLLALRDALLGNYDAARGHAEQGRDIAERVGDVSMLGMYFAFRLQVAYVRGDPRDVPDGADQVLARAPKIPLVRVAWPGLLALRGDHEAAVDAFAHLRELPDRMPLGPRWSATVSQVGQVAVQLGDAGVAAACHRLLLPTARWYGADGGGSPFSTGSNEHLLGLLAQCTGDLQTAAGHFERAVVANALIGARPYVALSRLGLAECLAGASQTFGAARPLAESAATELKRLRMPGPHRRAADLLGLLPGPASESTLTARESEVAGLVAQGLTNRQIATRLFLSVRTVESHVRGALAKAGRTSRTELAVWMVQGSPGRQG